MKQKGMNLEKVKIKNRTAILNFLISNGPTSRKDITGELSLTKGAITLLCAEMVEEGLIIDTGEVIDETKAGRRKILMDIKADFKFIISISIESEKTFITICNLKGVALATQTIKTNKDIPADEFLIKISTICKLMIWEENLQKNDILGIGVCVPGIVDKEKGISEKAYGIWDINVPVRKIIKENTGYPVIIENNVKAFAQGELLYGAGKKYDNLLFVKWGPGVGSAIVINDILYEGKDHKAAEIGHYIIEPHGKQCRCGRMGCLETKVSTNSIMEKITTVFSKEKTPYLYEKLNGNPSNIKTRIVQMLDDIQDEEIKQILEKCIERIARTVVNTMTILAPEKVILLGFAFDEPYIYNRFINHTMQYDTTYNHDYIKKSKLSHKINYIGPAAIIAKELFFEKGGIIHPRQD